MSLENSPTAILKKSPHIDQFSQEYQRIETKIRDYQEKKDELSKIVHDQTLQYDISKRQHLSRIAVFNERLNSVTQRKKEMKSLKTDITSAESAYKEANESNSKVLKEVSQLKKSLENIYQEIAESLTQVYEKDLNSNSDSSQKRILSSIDTLRKVIQNRNVHLMKIEELYSTASQKLSQIQKVGKQLIRKKQKLTEKESQIDSRRLQTLQIMAEPIDSLSYEEEVTKDVEKDAENAQMRISAEQKFDSQIALQNEDDFSQELSEISQIENNNSKRKVILAKKKEYVEGLKKTISKTQNSPNSERSPRKISPRKKPASPNVLNNNDMHTVVEQISQRLQKKQKEITELEKSIDELSAKNALWRKSKAKEWDEKIKKIEELSKQFHEVQSFMLAINEIKEQIEEEKQTSLDLESRIAQIKRRMDNVERDKNLNNNNNKNLQNIRKLYEEHKQEIEENQQRLEEMRESVSELEKSVKESEERYRKEEINTIKLEENVKKLEEKISTIVNKVHTEENQLDDLLKKMPKDQTKQFRDFRELFNANTEAA